MSNNPDMKLNVIQLGSGSKKYWQLSHNGEFGGPNHYPKVDVIAGAGADFEIDIVNPHGVTFSNDPIWIQAGTAKPTGKVIDPQITNIQGGGTTKLTFHDYNSGTATPLTYVLNFTGAPSLDPIIQNGGGGPPGFQNQILYGVAALLLLVVAFLVLRNRKAKPPIIRDENV